MPGTLLALLSPSRLSYHSPFFESRIACNTCHDFSPHDAIPLDAAALVGALGAADYKKRMEAAGFTEEEGLFKVSALCLFCSAVC
jgi:hypothetical protein